MIGDISTGTLRQVDLLSSFADTLEELLRAQLAKPLSAPQEFAQIRDKFKLIADARDTAEILDKSEGYSENYRRDDCEHASDVIAELIDALGEYALPFTYFGTHEGDGASFGFYPVDVNDAASDDPSDLEVRSDSLPDHVAVINDHGNVTLYAVTCSVVWDCV